MPTPPPPTPFRLVVLDGFALNPGDLSWDALQALGPCEIHDRTPPALTVSRAAGASLVLTNKTVVGHSEIAQLPGLRYLGVLATGTNVVDLEAAREAGIVVTNVPAYATPSVVQLTFGLLLELTLRTGMHSESVRAGRWSRSPDFSYTLQPLVELAGLTLGLVGFGHIGRAVTEVARAFGMPVLAHTRRPPAEPVAGVRFVDLETLLRESDVVSLNCPLTPETKHLINTRTLALMRPTAYLLNTGRGPLVDEAALAAALNAGRLAGAGLDVLSVEPPPADHPLLTARNCVITPHVGWATRAARERLLCVAVENVRAFLAGTPRNVVK
jgi:glycerate dehydrogenase